MSPQGLLLAAGAGRRMGRPKALVVDADGTSWLARGVAVLRDGGCDPVTVVLGARAAEGRGLVPPGVEVVEAADWAEGMSASLRAGLAGLSPLVDAAMVSLVDLPDVTADVVRRVVAGADVGPQALARATYDGRPGHPVLLGRDHWRGILESVAGDRGARDYLAHHAAAAVECGDLATGRDQDTPV